MDSFPSFQTMEDSKEAPVTVKVEKGASNSEVGDSEEKRPTKVKVKVKVEQGKVINMIVDDAKETPASAARYEEKLPFKVKMESDQWVM